MLYDQALLLMAYTEAFQATGLVRYRETAEAIAAYVLRDLASPEGAFLSAEDADSPIGEGAFYLWTAEEMEAVLGKVDAEIAKHVFNVRPGGNFSSPEGSGQENILYRTLTNTQLSPVTGIPEQELAGRLLVIREKLFVAREKRQRPSLDDKVLADWNGLMIAAFAKAARVFGNTTYRAAAERTMDFLLLRMRTGDGRLWHRYRDGEAAIMGFADDYAFVCYALVELYECTFSVRYLAEALALMKVFREHFLDSVSGGFFFVADDGEALLVRNKEIYDGAVPAANSVACETLLRLSHLTGDVVHEETASAIARAFVLQVQKSPSAFCWFLCAMERAVGPLLEIVIAGDEGSEDTQAFLAAIRSRYLPGSSVLFRSLTDQRQADELAAVAPFTRGIQSRTERATACLCSGNACSVPVTDPVLLGKELDKNR
jgi:hypothetical protein